MAWPYRSSSSADTEFTLRASAPEPGGAGRQGVVRRWRRARPFWGGLLLAFAGIEVLLVPLDGSLTHRAAALTGHAGIGGASRMTIGALLIAFGMLLWLNPARKTWYAVAGVLLAVASVAAADLGGFFLGALLGIAGGSLAFGWRAPPLVRTAVRTPPRGRAPGDPSDGPPWEIDTLIDRRQG